MGPEELALVRGREFYRSRMKVNCTTCGYCEPCPNGVSIPGVFSFYNSSAMFDSRATSADLYRMLLVRAARRPTSATSASPASRSAAGDPDRREAQGAHAHLMGPIERT